MATIDNTKYSNPLLAVELNWNSLFVSYSKCHWDAMLRFCLSLCNDKIQAEDLHQTSLLKALKAFQKFVLDYLPKASCPQDLDHLFASTEIQYHFKNWLYKIVKNTYMDERATQQRWQRDFSDEALENFAAFSLQDPPRMEVSLSTGQKSIRDQEKDFYQFALDDHLKKRLEQLNDRQRSILFLAAEDYSYKEISNILGIPIGTVMSTLFRAVQKLRAKPFPLE
jgi:RNA polymerase sigma factor (sigma-70 family)